MNLNNKLLFYLPLILCLLFSCSIVKAQNNKQLNSILTDTVTFNKFTDSCIAAHANDYLIEFYDKMIVDEKIDMLATHIPFLQTLYYQMNHHQFTQNNYAVCCYLGRIITKYHLDMNSPVLYFNEALNIAQHLPNKCLVPKTYKYLSSFYSNVRHDLRKTYELNNKCIEYFKQNQINGILDCNIDVNIGAATISYYLEAYDRGVAQLNVSIATVRKINKPKQLFDLYKRRSFYEIELNKYNDVLKTIDTAESIIDRLPDKNILKNFTTAIRFNVLVNEGYYERANECAKLVNADLLKEDNDDYFDYMNNFIKMNIQFNKKEEAKAEIDNYASLLKPWNIQRWRKLYEVKYLLAKKNNDYETALDAYQHFRYYDDSVHSQKHNLAIMDQQIIYETKGKDELLKAEIKQNFVYRLVVICGSLMAAIIILLIYSNFIRSKKSVQHLTILNDEINEQRHQIGLALTQVESANKDKDRILNVVAHDLRNPIGAIANFLEIVQVKYEHNEEEERILNTSQQAAIQSLTLINDLLEVNQMQSGKLELFMSPVSLAELIEKSIEQVKYKAIAKQQTIMFDNHAKGMLIHGDAVKLQRVITNLIDNAIKFSYIQKEIVVTLERGSSNAILKVIDHGMGIPEAIQQQLFTASITVKRMGTNNEKSHGLGLSICKQIIEAHQGTIEVVSEIGKGSSFIISMEELIA